MTIRQSEAINLITSKKVNTVGKGMRQAGYSVSTSKVPKKLTESKAWKTKLGALAKANNVTIEQYMMNLGLGMTAMKQNQFTGEITEDITTRLSANKQAERFILNESKPNTIGKEQFKDLANESDEIKLQEIIFSKNG